MTQSFLRCTRLAIVVTTLAYMWVACVANQERTDSITVFLIPSPSASAIQAFVPVFERQTGIEVMVVQAPYGEAHQKLLLAFELGRGAYDVAQFDNIFLATFGVSEVMTPLDIYLEDSMEYAIEDFSSSQQDYGKYAGKTFGLTLSTEPMIQWYRKDMYDSLGLTPAVTWEEYRDNAKAVHESGLGVGFILGWGPNVPWWWVGLVWSFGGQLYDEDLIPTVNTPEVIAATTYLKDLLDYGSEGGLSADGDMVTHKFLSQNIGSMMQFSGYYGMTLDPDNTSHFGLVETAPMPRGKVDVTHLAGWNIGIPMDSKKKTAAWRFLEFVLGKTNSKEYLSRGAAAIGRRSITEDPTLLEKHPYLPHLRLSGDRRIERYPQLTVWPEFEKSVADALRPILTGEHTVNEGLDALQEKLRPLLARERELR